MPIIMVIAYEIKDSQSNFNTAFVIAIAANTDVIKITIPFVAYIFLIWYSGDFGINSTFLIRPRISCACLYSSVNVA